MGWESRLPHDKLIRIHTMVKHWKGCYSCKAKKLESLLGCLQKVARVVPSGITFTQRIIDFHQPLPPPTTSVSTVASAQTMSGSVISFFHGMECLCSLLPTMLLMLLSLVEHTNPALGSRFAGQSPGQQWISQQKYCYLLSWHSWPTIWENQWSGSSVLIWCDNIDVVHILRSGYAKNDDVMHFICCFFLITTSFSLFLLSQHLPSCHNQSADALSWDHLPLFYSLVAQGTLSPSPIPFRLVELLVSPHLDWADKSWTTWFLSIWQRV